MSTHSSTLARKISWTEGPRRLPSMGLPRVGHDWTTLLSLFTFMHWRRKWQPTPVFLSGESQGQRSLGAALCGVAQGRTRLKQLSSSSSSVCLLVAQLCPTLATPWTVAHRDPLSMEFSRQEFLEWVSHSFSRVPSSPRDWTQVSCFTGRLFTVWATREAC